MNTIRVIDRLFDGQWLKRGVLLVEQTYPLLSMSTRPASEDIYTRKTNKDFVEDGFACEDIFTEEDIFTDKDAPEKSRYFADDKKVDEEPGKILAEVDAKKEPVCTAADGMNLVDDVGGVHGFIDFLKTLNGKDREEANKMREWARSLGWTGRMGKPENIL